MNKDLKELLMVFLVSLVTTFLLFLLASCATKPCPETQVTNMTLEPWNNHDQKILDFNKGFCERKYGPLKACVKKFYKTGTQDYHIICGR